MKIFRYVLDPPVEGNGCETVVQLPKGAQILTVQVKLGESIPSLWAMVDPSQPIEDRTLLILPTGIDVPNNWKFMRYIDTFQVSDIQGTLCFHIFEQTSD